MTTTRCLFAIPLAFCSLFSPFFLTIRSTNESRRFSLETDIRVSKNAAFCFINNISKNQAEKNDSRQIVFFVIILCSQRNDSLLEVYCCTNVWWENLTLFITKHVKYGYLNNVERFLMEILKPFGPGHPQAGWGWGERGGSGGPYVGELGTLWELCHNSNHCGGGNVGA